MIAVLLAVALGASPPADDLGDARTAWRYFERNTDPGTGLVASVEGFGGATSWDLGSSVIGLVAARELGLIGAEELRARARRLLRTLEEQPLHGGALPNKAFDVATGAMTDYSNRPASQGIGYSAVDLGRIVSALVLLGALHPDLREPVRRVLARWEVCRVARAGELHGVHLDAAGTLREAQEGRLGYEQYAAKGLALLGLDVGAARRHDRFAVEEPILGVRVPRDRRTRDRFGAVDAVVTEPWVLDAFEHGLDEASRPLARRIFDVQKRRWEKTGVVTALSEDHVDRPPWFVYDGIWADGGAWQTVGPDGKRVEGVRALSTKAALALAALFPDDPYADVLRRAVEGARDPERGWYAGLYEDGGTPNRAVTANTNGIVLEAALFARVGPLHAAAAARPGAAAWRRNLVRACAAAPAAATGATPARPVPAAPAPARPRRRAVVTGEVVADYRGADGPGYGLLATISPRQGWFLRLGGDATPVSRFGTSRFLWGFGYDDWRDGTLSVTVHDWGPVRPEQGFGVRGAELNVAYKIPRACAGWVCAALHPSVTVPYAGGPYVGARLTLTVAGSWFVMGGLGWTVPGVFPGPAGTPRARVVYGFGRRDWRPGSVFVTYHDWGPDERARNGVLAVGVNWAF